MTTKPSGPTASLILFAHGARDPAWRRPIDALAARMSAALPGVRVLAAFLELMEPGLPETIAQATADGARRVVIAPVFWAPGSHLRKDVPALIEKARAQHPGVQFQVWSALGESDAVLDAITHAYLRLWQASS
ncbi:MAG: CbiX/SirB N-terminal domain-containing protein [Quisquiliibacterium sp.]